MKTSFASAFALSFAAWLPAGCSVPADHQPVTMQDSFDSDAFGPHTNDMHSPYAPGAVFKVYVTASTASADGWTLTSSNPSVLAVSPEAGVNGSTLTVDAQAGVQGTTTLTVLDAQQQTVDTATVSVVLPTSAQIEAYGRLLAGETDSQAAITNLQVVEGGTATVLVRYYAGGQEVSGIGSPGVAVQGFASASMRASTIAADRDWLEVGGGQLGPGQVRLVLGGTTIATVPVSVVPASSIASVTLDKQTDGLASDGTALFVFARGLDATGADVFGASYAWALNGGSLDGGAPTPGEPTDLLGYTYASAATETASASLGGVSSSVPIHALRTTDPSEAPTVTSTAAATGCDASGGPAGDAAFGWIGLVAVTGALATRRRRALT